MASNLANGESTAQGSDRDAMRDHRRVSVTVRVLPSGNAERFHLPANSTLRELLEEGARRLPVELLPPAPQSPLDLLHGLLRHDEVGPAIAGLDQAIADYLDQPGTTHDFGIELVLAFHVNTRWGVATSEQMTPRQIFALPAIGLDYTKFTLYRPGSADPLPLDEPIAMTRGLALEAQCDGRYGEHQ